MQEREIVEIPFVYKMKINGLNIDPIDTPERTLNLKEQEQSTRNCWLQLDKYFLNNETAKIGTL